MKSSVCRFMRGEQSETPVGYPCSLSPLVLQSPRRCLSEEVCALRQPQVKLWINTAAKFSLAASMT